jgi:hypothetical protein
MHEEVITRHQLGLPIVTPELTARCQQYQYLQSGRAGGTSGTLTLPVMLDQNMQWGITWLIAKYSGSILFGWRCTKLCI